MEWTWHKKTELGDTPDELPSDIDNSISGIISSLTNAIGPSDKKKGRSILYTIAKRLVMIGSIFIARALNADNEKVKAECERYLDLISGASCGVRFTSVDPGFTMGKDDELLALMPSNLEGRFKCHRCDVYLWCDPELEELIESKDPKFIQCIDCVLGELD